MIVTKLECSSVCVLLLGLFELFLLGVTISLLLVSLKVLGDVPWPSCLCESHSRCGRDYGEHQWGNRMMRVAVLLGLYALMYYQMFLGVIFIALWFSTNFLTTPQLLLLLYVDVLLVTRVALMLNIWVGGESTVSKYISKYYVGKLNVHPGNVRWQWKGWFSNVMLAFRGVSPGKWYVQN